MLDDDGVEGDWRKFKDQVSFVPAQIPVSVKEKCIQLVQRLNLVYGAIDLIFHNNKYYFIEVNPTGEWAWLVDSANQKIYESICDYLGR